MSHVPLKTFLGELQALATMPVFKIQDITPWAFDVLEPLGSEASELHKAIKILHRCLQFLEIKNPAGSALFFLEKRTFHVFAQTLKVRHADSIEIYRLTDECDKCCNDTFTNVFCQLSNELLIDDMDNSSVRSLYTNALITIITLAFNDGLPLLATPDLNAWTNLPVPDMKYGLAKTLNCAPFILKMRDDNNIYYINTLNQRSIALGINEPFQIGHFITIFNPRINYSGQDRMLDMLHYDIKGDVAYSIIEKANKEVI